jgi:hypothetical protein
LLLLSVVVALIDVFVRAAKYVAGWSCAMGCNPTVHLGGLIGEGWSSPNLISQNPSANEDFSTASFQVLRL